MPAQRGLIGHWPLKSDFRDASGRGHHGSNLGVAFNSTGALFNGAGSRVTIPPHPEFDLHSQDFTLSVWVDTAAQVDGVLGDLVSKYDHARRTGFTLGFLDTPGSVYSTPNRRNLEFGIAADHVDLPWTDSGRPGNAVNVFSLCTHDGHLYAGTFEGGEGDAGRVYVWRGGLDWEDCGSPDGSNAVMSLCVFDGELYCGTGHYHAGGSALSDSPNTLPGGHVYRYAGPGRWVDCGKLSDEAEEAHSLTVFSGALFAIPSYTKGVYRWDGDSSWEWCGAPGDRRCMTLGVHGGSLYAGGNEFSGVWRYVGGAEWESVGTQVGPAAREEDGYSVESQIYSFITWNDQLHIGTWPSGSVFSYEGDSDWKFRGRLGDEREVMGVAAYNGSLYAGSLPLANVYRYDGGEEWSVTGRLDHTRDVTYRRAWSMAVYDGMLFCGTLPSGRVWRFRAGACATHDYPFPPGPHHVAAVRHRRRVYLYVDGIEVSRSPYFEPADYDLANDQPLVIGGGPRASFLGRLWDVRLYDRALVVEEIAGLRSGG